MTNNDLQFEATKVFAICDRKLKNIALKNEEKEYLPKKHCILIDAFATLLTKQVGKR
jgi:hypothetical protein